MPRYDFRCSSCGHEYEKWVSYAKKDETECPVCQSKEKEHLYKALVKGPISSSGFSGGCGGGSGFT